MLTTTWDQQPVAITVAPIGAEVTRDDNPALPYTAAETVAASLEAIEAGASIVHLHARLEDGTPSGDPALFAEMIDGIRAKSNAVTNTSTGGATWMSADERSQCLDAGPDVCSLETGSMNFGDELFSTSRPDGIAIAEKARAQGIKTEVELFDVGHAVAAMRLLKEGHLQAPLIANLVVGVPGGMDCSIEGLQSLLRPLPDDIWWSVTAIGRHQRRMLGLAILMGADGIRVGFEDNVRIGKGRLAASNAELVEDAAMLVRTLGRRVATPEEVRSRIGLSQRQTP